MTTKNNALTFQTGEAVVYPSHGVGLITGIEEQEIADSNFKLLVITFDSGNSRFAFLSQRRKQRLEEVVGAGCRQGSNRDPEWKGSRKARHVEPPCGGLSGAHRNRAADRHR